jgi:hypothetical protein
MIARRAKPTPATPNRPRIYVVAEPKLGLIGIIVILLLSSDGQDLKSDP